MIFPTSEEAVLGRDKHSGYTLWSCCSSDVRDLAPGSLVDDDIVRFVRCITSDGV